MHMRYHVHLHWIYAYIVDRRRSTERRLHFGSPTRTRVNSDSCVNDGYCLRHFSVDTVPSTYFFLFPSRTLPPSTRTMTHSGQLRSSISLPGYHVDFFTFAEHVSFEHSTASPWPVIYSGREGNINKQTKLKSLFTLNRRSGSPHRPAHACVLAIRGQCAIWRWRGASTFLATKSTGTVLTPRQMSEIAGHGLTSADADRRSHSPMPPRTMSSILWQSRSALNNQ